MLLLFPHEDVADIPFSSGIEIADLPGAIPMHLDFIIMDACLMGCVEVAYELRDKCDILIFSPTEILSSGILESIR